MKEKKLSLAEESSLLTEVLDSINVNRFLATGQVFIKHMKKEFFANRQYLQIIKELQEKSLAEIELTLPLFLAMDIKEHALEQINNSHTIHLSSLNQDHILKR